MDIDSSNQAAQRMVMVYLVHFMNVCVNEVMLVGRCSCPIHGAIHGGFPAGLRREQKEAPLIPWNKPSQATARGINSSLSPNSHLILHENS
jgi:hypothetical protein